MMSKAENRSIERITSYEIKKLSPAGKQIITGMINESLDIARSKTEVLIEKRYKIGEHELCEPDYLQILEWARVADMDPEDFLNQRVISVRNEALIEPIIVNY